MTRVALWVHVILLLAACFAQAQESPKSQAGNFGESQFAASAVRPNSLWAQLEGGGSLYDARREVFSARISSSLKLGRRYTTNGYFFTFEIDRSMDFTQEVKHLTVYHVGAGLELLQFLGRVRSSIAAGAAILHTDTDIDRRGRVGWFVDLRPASLRWPLGKRYVLELSPLTMDLSVPVPNGIPLILFSYFTVLTFEWADEGRYVPSS